jgi:hypothetical protein
VTGRPSDPAGPTGGAPGAGPIEPPRPGRTEASDALDASEPDVTAEQLSLVHRLRQPRTIISLILPIILLALIVRVAANIDLEELAAGIGRANPGFLALGFAVFYLGFPLRGLRWALLLRGTGLRVGIRDASEIIFLSWLVNCVVPAKLGDVYRAYLLKINATVSLSRTFGTVFIERILDLFAISVLGLAAAFWSFRTGLPTEAQFVVALGVGVIVLLAIGLLTMRNFGRRLVVALPLPDRVLELYDKFEQGVFGAVGVRGLVPLVAITGLIWATEAARLYFVILALDLPGVSLGISGVVFVALIASLLTAVPLSPAGLGVVEGGMFFVLTAAYGIGATPAATITVVDRLISFFSIILLGAIAYALSSKRRGSGLRGAAAVT